MMDVGPARPDQAGRAASSDGFTEFVTARSPALLRTAWFLTGDETRAEDLVQESLAKAWRRWPTIQRIEQPEAYVRRVMVNTSVSGLRRRWRGEIPTARLPEHAATDAIERADLRHALRTALATLSPRQRAVVALRYVDDVSETQTAALLGCSVGTVKSQASRALARLRDCPQLQGLAMDGQIPTEQETADDSLAGLASAVTARSIPMKRVAAAARRQRRAAVLTRGVTAGALTVAAYAVHLTGVAGAALGPGPTVTGPGAGAGQGPGTVGVTGPAAAVGVALVLALLFLALSGLAPHPVSRAGRMARAAARVNGLVGLWMAAALLADLQVLLGQQPARWRVGMEPLAWPALVAAVLVCTAIVVRRRTPDAPGAVRRTRGRQVLHGVADLASMCAGICGSRALVALPTLVTRVDHRSQTVRQLLYYVAAPGAVCVLIALLVPVLAAGSERGRRLRAAGARAVTVSSAASVPQTIVWLQATANPQHPSVLVLAVLAAGALARLGPAKPERSSQVWVLGS